MPLHAVFAFLSVEIRRFGIGHRRAEGPPGSRGVEGQPIHSDSRGVVAELALRPHAAMTPHANPNLCYLVVIEGGGFVQVGEERARVAAGEAVLWPPNVIHAAWTELTPMRAIVVEFAGGEPSAAATESLVLEAAAGIEEEGPDRADGALQPKPAVRPAEHETPEGEPW